MDRIPNDAPLPALPPVHVTPVIMLPWDIVYLLEQGHITDAVETLATQRRITPEQAALTITRWIDHRAAEARA